ncbi:MAG: sortase, partial [Chloroflexota bacterium]
NRLANYTVVLNTGTLTVGNTVLTVTANNQSIVYGDPDPIFTFSYSGFTNGDTPAVLTTLPTCQVLPAHNATGTFPITCSGGIDDNYIFSYVPATLTVTSRALTVTPANQTKIYGAVFTAFTGATTGIQGADNITVTYNSAGAAAIATVGTYPITATLNDPNNRLGNYTITLNAGTMTVTQRPLVATSDDKAKAYGTLFTAFTGSIVGIQNGDNITATYTSVGAPIAAAAGAYPITIALNDPNNQLPNYTVTYNIGTLAVGGNVLIITPADKTKVYGDVFTAFTGTIVGLQAGDVITATYSSVGAAANAAVGNYDITATLNDPGNKLPNYTVILNTGTLSVTPRVLTVTPDNKAKVFGTLFTAFTGTVTGVQTGDNITASYASTGAPIAAATGTYPIITTLNDPNNRLANYTVTINAGTLTVGLSVLTVTANNQTLVYGTPDPVFTFNYAGFAPGDTAAVIDTPPTCQVLPAHNAIGTYPITCSGGVDNSYVFTYTAGTLTVTSRALTVTPDNKSKVYGDTFTAFTGTLTGLQASDNITAVYASTGAPAPATVGNYQITVPTINDPGNRLGNYTVTTNTGTLTVTQRPLTVTSADKIKFYGSLFTAFTGTITGIQNGDIITANYASAGGSVTAIVGDYPITITLNDPGTRLGNYTVTNNPGTLTVAPRDLVITPADKTKAFGSVFNTFTGTVIGIRNGDNITATYNSAGTPAIAPVGTYDINATLVDPANRLPNYDVSLNPGTLMVAVNAQTITIMIPAPASAGFNTGFTVAATASSGLPVVYSAGGTACTNVGATFTMTANTGVCIVQYDQPGDTNYPPAPQLTQTVSTQKASQTITVTTSAPVTALNGTSFSVAATSSSGLPVNIISNGNCSGNGSNTATITMATGTGLCTVIYGQAGNANYLAATSITEVVSITNAPIVTFNPQDVWVLPGATATFTAAAVGNPNPTVQWQVSADGGTTFTNIPGATSTTFSLPAQLVDNGLRYQAVFTNTEGTATTTTAVLHVDTLPPTVVKVNSVSDTGDGRLDEMETSTVAITQLLVTFNEDLGNPVGNTATNDVTNPANYLLVRDNGDGIQTALCSAGVTGGDIAVTVSQVSYSNNGGSGPYISTLALNGGAAIPNGTYRLITCGTTSITDVAGNKLAGDNATTGTDFTRNFIVAVTSGGGGGDGGNGNGKPQTSGGFLIPVTGFPQNHVTILPAQPANMTYAATDLWLEIPKLKLKMSIVGVPQTKTGWDISWLGSNAGWLNGSAFPTWKGNSVITAHVWDELNKPGPFVGLVNLQYGDQVKVHAFGNVYTYEVTSSSLISPSSTSKAFQHEDKSWLTLITCENYIEKTETYTHRRMVRALLVSVTKEK